MSWVTNVILIFSLHELFDEEDREVEVLPALTNINTWLVKNGYGELDNLSQHIQSGGQSMQACVYGGAFNYLDIERFKEIVKVQNWKARKNVQLLIQEEQEDHFTMYILTKDKFVVPLA